MIMIMIMIMIMMIIASIIVFRPIKALDRTPAAGDAVFSDRKYTFSSLGDLGKGQLGSALMVSLQSLCFV